MDEVCVCPTPQEKEAAQRLISSAAEATELMTDDYLEATDRWLNLILNSTK